MNEIYLKIGKDKAVHRKHPWIFSGAIGTLKGNPVNGEPVRVFNSAKDFIGIGSFSPQSQIRVRMWTFQDEEINEEFFFKKINSSIQRRKQALYGVNDTAWRLVFAESDQIPGLIVDQYNDVLVIQVLFSGIEYFRDQILSALKDATKIENIYERSDLDVRKLEGLPERTGLLGGVVPDLVEIVENGYKFLVDIKNGHKTGFYIDQRINRKIVANYCKGKSVLNVFSYTGGFSIYASGNGAKKVISVDSSQEVISLAKRNHRLNGFEENSNEWIEGDAFQELRRMRDRDLKFDLIILDPPKFAPTASHVNRAARAYKDINLLSFKLLNPEGILVTFSCSGGITDSLFQKIVADATLDADVHASILERLTQGPDHPIGLNYPEGAYLKGLVCIKN